MNQRSGCSQATDESEQRNSHNSPTLPHSFSAASRTRRRTLCVHDRCWEPDVFPEPVIITHTQRNRTGRRRRRKRTVARHLQLRLRQWKETAAETNRQKQCHSFYAALVLVLWENEWLSRPTLGHCVLLFLMSLLLISSPFADYYPILPFVASLTFTPEHNRPIGELLGPG
jgi:hypothetical protein